MRKGEYYIAKEIWCAKEYVMVIQNDEGFDTEEEAMKWVDKTFWPSDEVYLLKCIKCKELP